MRANVKAVYCTDAAAGFLHLPLKHPGLFTARGRKGPARGSHLAWQHSVKQLWLLTLDIIKTSVLVNGSTCSFRSCLAQAQEGAMLSLG